MLPRIQPSLRRPGRGGLKIFKEARYKEPVLVINSNSPLFTPTLSFPISVLSPQAKHFLIPLWFGQKHFLNPQTPPWVSPLHTPLFSLSPFSLNTPILSLFLSFSLEHKCNFWEKQEDDEGLISLVIEVRMRSIYLLTRFMDGHDLIKLLVF